MAKLGMTDSIDAEAKSAVAAAQACNNPTGGLAFYPACTLSWTSSCNGEAVGGIVGSTRWSCSSSFFIAEFSPELGKVAWQKWVQVRVWR